MHDRFPKRAHVLRLLFVLTEGFQWANLARFGIIAQNAVFVAPPSRCVISTIVLRISFMKKYMSTVFIVAIDHVYASDVLSCVPIMSSSKVVKKVTEGYVRTN